MKRLFLRNWHNRIASTTVLMLMNSSVFAANLDKTDLPFQQSMGILQAAISGPFLMSASIVMIVVTCMMLAFGEWGDGFKKIINISLWLGMAFGATSFVKTMFASGAVF